MNHLNEDEFIAIFFVMMFLIALVYMIIYQNKKKPVLFEIKQNADGWYYISVQGNSISETLTEDYDTALKYFEYAKKSWFDKRKKPTIIKSETL